MTALALAGQTLVVIGGSSGIGKETARRAHEAGASLILTARNADRVHHAGLELGASIAAFDATDSGRLERFFDEVSAPIDHVLITVPGDLVPQHVARSAGTKIRPGGTLLFTGCAADGPALPALAQALALELAPVRVNLILASAGAVETAGLALQLLTGSAATGATFEVDGLPEGAIRQA